MYTLSKAALIGAFCAAGVDAFATSSCLPMQARRSAAVSPAIRLRAQADNVIPPPEEDPAVPEATTEAKSVATGGTSFSAVPKKKGTLFGMLLPKTSIIGDGEMVGDKGFDPLGFADSIENLKSYREAELKHGRLAMLAALGWPLSEQLNGPLSKALGMPNLLQPGFTPATAGVEGAAEVLSRAPSVLNGGLGNVSPIFFGLVFLFSGAVENYASSIKRTDNYLPGDLGFDPLGLYQKKDPAGKKDIQLKELNNGRLAMMAITFYAINEAVTKIAVVPQ